MILLSSGSSAIQLIQVCLIFVFVLAVTYATTRFIAGYQKGIDHDRGIQVLQSAKIANNKYIEIVKVQNEYLVLGISKDNITLLTKLSEEQVQDLLRNPASAQNSFGDSLNQVMGKMKEKFPKK